MDKRLYVGEWLLTEITTKHLVKELLSEGYNYEEVREEIEFGKIKTRFNEPITDAYNDFGIHVPVLLTRSGKDYDLVVDKNGTAAEKYDWK